MRPRRNRPHAVLLHDAYFLSTICKIDQPEIPAMVRGQRIHNLAEGLLKGTVTGMPKDLEKFAPELRRLKRLGVTVVTTMDQPNSPFRAE